MLSVQKLEGVEGAVNYLAGRDLVQVPPRALEAFFAYGPQ